jgi:hypothetical protein
LAWNQNVRKTISIFHPTNDVYKLLFKTLHGEEVSPRFDKEARDADWSPSGGVVWEWDWDRLLHQC